MLEEFSDIELVGAAADGPQAVQEIDRLRPDLLFLDIHIPGCSGLEVLQKCRHRPIVIFVTAYDQYAIDAFEQNAIDYLLKPTSQDRLRKTIERIRRQGSGMAADILPKLAGILQRQAYLQRFTVALGDDILIIPEEDIVYFSAEDKYIFLHTASRKYIYSMTLKELDENLDPNRFCRIHKSHIVAIGKIERIKKWFHGEYILQMADSGRSRLKVSRGALPLLKNKIPF